jgi:hypothetical protein
MRRRCFEREREIESWVEKEESERATACSYRLPANQGRRSVDGQCLQRNSGDVAGGTESGRDDEEGRTDAVEGAERRDIFLLSRLS